MDFKHPEWQKVLQTGLWAQRMEMGFTRAGVALLIPVCIYYFYSGWLALVVAVPCGYVLYWLGARAVQRFTKRES